MAAVALLTALAALTACSDDVITTTAPAPTATIVPTTADALGGRPEPVTAVSVPTQLYVVQPGDTLFDIAARFGVTVDEIVKTSKLRDPESLHAGQQLLLPIPPTTTAPGAPTTLPGATSSSPAGATSTTATTAASSGATSTTAPAATTPPATEASDTTAGAARPPAMSTVTSVG